MEDRPNVNSWAYFPWYWKQAFVKTRAGLSRIGDALLRRGKRAK